jgi:hypothetical protein
MLVLRVDSTWTAVPVLLIWLIASPAAVQVKSSPEAALAQAEARWRERGPKSYQYQVSITCECPRFLNDQVRVVNGVPEPVKGLDGFNTIEKLFEQIRRSISAGQHRVSVKYDEQFGYPRSADLDPRREVKDDELYFVVRSFRPNTTRFP